jgi:hypothetical protein
MTRMRRSQGDSHPGRVRRRGTEAASGPAAGRGSRTISETLRLARTAVTDLPVTRMALMLAAVSVGGPPSRSSPGRGRLRRRTGLETESAGPNAIHDNVKCEYTATLRWLAWSRAFSTAARQQAPEVILNRTRNLGKKGLRQKVRKKDLDKIHAPFVSVVAARQRWVQTHTSWHNSRNKGLPFSRHRLGVGYSWIR